jgi:hypothetical protein
MNPRLITRLIVCGWLRYDWLLRLLLGYRPEQTRLSRKIKILTLTQDDLTILDAFEARFGYERLFVGAITFIYRQKSA